MGDSSGGGATRAVAQLGRGSSAGGSGLAPAPGRHRATRCRTGRFQASDAEPAREAGRGGDRRGRRQRGRWRAAGGGEGGSPGEVKPSRPLSAAGALAAKAGRIAAGTAINLAQGSYDVAKERALEIKDDMKERVADTTLSGRIASGDPGKTGRHQRRQRVGHVRGKQSVGRQVGKQQRKSRPSATVNRNHFEGTS